MDIDGYDYRLTKGEFSEYLKLSNYKHEGMSFEYGRRIFLEGNLYQNFEDRVTLNALEEQKSKEYNKNLVFGCGDCTKTGAELRSIRRAQEAMDHEQIVNKIDAGLTIAGWAGVLKGGGKIVCSGIKKLSKLDLKISIKRSKNNLKFPHDPDELTKMLNVEPQIKLNKQKTLQYKWRPNESTKIRYESHPDGLKVGDLGFRANHNGPHYHVDIRRPGLPWNQAKHMEPNGYKPGDGTGFLPGDLFPGAE